MTDPDNAPKPGDDAGDGKGQEPKPAGEPGAPEGKPPESSGTDDGKKPEDQGKPGAGKPEGGEGTEEGKGQEPKKPDEDPAVAEARREAAKYRKRAQEAEAKVQEHEDAKLSEKERAEKERDKAKADLETKDNQVKAAILRSAVVSAAAEANVRKPEVAVKLIDRDKVEWGEDDDGLPKVDNAKKLVEDLLAEHEYLKAPEGTADATSTAQPAGHGKPKEETDQERYQRIYGGGDGVWGEDAVRRQGGGVVRPSVPAGK